MSGRLRPLDSRRLDRRLKALGCVFLRQKGSHRHYANPFKPAQIITYADHPGDIPKGIIAAIQALKTKERVKTLFT